MSWKALTLLLLLLHALLLHIHHAASSHVMLLPAVCVQFSILGMLTVML